MTTYRQFFTAVLSPYGAVSEGALQGMATVVHEEGANDYWNPWNIEYHPGDNTVYQGVSDFNSVGVQRYADSSHGIAALATWLTQPHWQPVLSALKTGSYGAVVTALTQAYSWAAFNPGSQQQAADLLNQPMPGTDDTPQSGSETPITEEFTLNADDEATIAKIVMDQLAQFFENLNGKPAGTPHEGEGFGRVVQAFNKAAK